MNNSVRVSFHALQWKCEFSVLFKHKKERKRDASYYESCISSVSCPQNYFYLKLATYLLYFQIIKHVLPTLCSKTNTFKSKFIGILKSLGYNFEVSNNLLQNRAEGRNLKKTKKTPNNSCIELQKTHFLSVLFYLLQGIPECLSKESKINFEFCQVLKVPFI